MTKSFAREETYVSTSTLMPSLARESAMSAWYLSLPVKLARMTGSSLGVMNAADLWGSQLRIGVHLESY